MTTRRKSATKTARWRTPGQKPLYTAVDHGHAIVIRQSDFAPLSRGGGWGTFADSFIRFNERSLRELDVGVELVASNPEPAIRLSPGGNAGAIPLRSAQTGAVVAGLIVKPRFGWPGVGTVMSETGWAASPHFLDLPLVPGSARQVPPWVLAGPVLFRLQSLLANLSPGYSVREETLSAPRGRVVWPRYVSESLARGRWHRLPCRYPDLTFDPAIRSYVRWAVERVCADLVTVGHGEAVARALVRLATQIVESLADVRSVRPRSGELERMAAAKRLLKTALVQGLQALGWVADERGLGGGQEMDGLAWQLALEQLWERYVEAHVREEVAREGGELRVGRLGQTTMPIHWSTSTARTMTQLVPDIVVRRGRSVRVVDAKYKAHFAELDEHAWMQFSEEIRDAHRADVHQVLAYASLYDADEVTATLVYPLRRSTWENLKERQRDSAYAELYRGNRSVRLELKGLPFGRA